MRVCTVSDHAHSYETLCVRTVQDDKALRGAPGWLSLLSVRLGSGHGLAVREFEPRLGLCADSSEPEACFGSCVSLSLCPSPTHALYLSLSLPQE